MRYGVSSCNLMSIIQVGPLERELWEAEGEEDGRSSGDGVLHSSVTATSAASTAASTSTAAGGDPVGTATPETDTGTDFGLLGSYTKGTPNEKCAGSAGLILFPVPV